MSESIQDRRFPRGALLGAAALIGLTIAAVAASRVSGLAPLPIVSGAPVETREYRFMDRQDGAVAVYAPDTDVLVHVVPPGTNGFLRSVLRGLARERKLESVGIQPPFRLTRWDDGRLSLDDPSTGRRIDDLAAFGPTNEAAFAILMSAGDSAP